MFVQNMYDDIQRMVKSLIVKREDLAAAKEDINTLKSYDKYYSFLNNVAFDFIQLDEDILTEVLPTYTMVVSAQSNRYTIPEEYWDEIYRKQKERYFDNYVEGNDYYRQLYGLPDTVDTSYIYITDITGVRTDVPIHELNDTEIGLLSISDKLDELKTLYPSRGYLNFLGPEKIHFHTARQTPNFYILKLGPSSDSMNEEIFRSEYHKTLKFHIASIYKKDLFLTNEVYDGMIGIMILVSAIRNSLATDQSLTFSETFMNNILKAYGLYADFHNMPTTYKKRLVLNIDKLISKQHTDSVLVNITELFGYNNVVANRYYLTKSHAKDINGNPIFPKLGDDSIDYDSQYSLEFVKVDVSKTYVDLENSTKVSYESLTEDDPTWVYSDITSLKKREFNVHMSKYMSIEAAYNVTELSYELSYFLNLLLDTKDYHKEKYPNIHSSTGSSDIFTYIIFMLATAAKVNGYDGNVPLSPAYIGQVYKFDLDQMEESLQTVIDTYNLPITTQEIMLKKPGVAYNSTDDIINLYVANTAIYDKIHTLKENTDDYYEYVGYDNLITSLFVAENLSNIYTKTDETIAETYYELLMDIDPTLANILDITTETELPSVYLYILETLQSVFDTNVLKFLFINTPDMNDSIIRTHLKNLIDRFKAPKVKLDKIDIYFPINEDSAVLRVFDIVHQQLNNGVIETTTIEHTLQDHREFIVTDQVLTLSDSLKTIL